MKGHTTVATALGLRDHQEDRVVDAAIDAADIHGRLMAVMDGHGGIGAAEAVARSLAFLFQRILTVSQGDVALALRSTVSELAQMTRREKSGTTLSLVFVPQDTEQAHVALIGDSPVIILDETGSLHIGPDHNVRSNPGELAAARRRGAVYQMGYIFDPQTGAGLQMSRSLGDCELARVLSDEPEIYRVKLGKESIVVLASDGVFDPGHVNTGYQIKRIIALVRKGADAQTLVDDAVARSTADNATALIWRPLDQSRK